jgi:prepilin-type N-terminal cleavage/methylation domain-containing protein
MRRRARTGGAQAGFSLPELLVAMVITVSLMAIVFSLMRQNQGIFQTETGVTSMNENVRAAVDLVTREIQAAGTGLRGMSAPILGVDGEGDNGDRLAILLGDPYAPVAQVKSVGVSQAAVIVPGSAAPLVYKDDRGRDRRLYEPGDRYLLYNGERFLVVRVGSASASPSGDVFVTFSPDKSNPRSRYGDYRFDPSRDANGALLARLDAIVTYRYDGETETLERRENHEPWAAVARGIIGFQVRYRSLGDGTSLGTPLDEPPADRADIRSVVVTLRARTPDAEKGSPQYRETAERFEVTPRNMRVVRDAGPDAGS